MKERIQEFLRSQNKTSSQFAEEIGVEPSGISHIISGRNKPSLDFVLKMLTKYPYISSDWILFGRGKMLIQPDEPVLFDTPFLESKADLIETGQVNVSQIKPGKQPDKGPADTNGVQTQLDGSGIKRIVWFYGDGTFLEFFPRTD